ncbi:flagellar basal-body P-ring protein [Halobacteroides halobius DSM 5150]|uniref:Flagellar P-ring protein n=1 Tax=Halobacteroides halobius (strain ATCC 35273 / DSM 5150 / MD-1) TaxID=748449 RepID=L0KBF5_HALHC|nr:flagellar basal body P-ring protein FlgI [Halobacteroides halobius]AGB42321.1 flagellar basal-body P-ring protein [Halobacteroides halobius DSM 5150]
MKRYLISILFIILIVNSSVMALTPDQPSVNEPLVRIKDITRVKGVRDNQLIGYGLVVGLNGTGDGDSAYTVQSVANMLQNFGIQVNPAEIGTDNVAAVMVTAKLPPFARAGDKIDITLSSIGSADSLAGGTLLMTPLQGPRQQKVYAMAQGPVLVGGGNGGTATVGRVPNGAIIERVVPTKFTFGDQVTLILSNSNFSTAQRIADVINNNFGYTPTGGAYAKALDASRVAVKIPQHFKNNKVNFISRINQLEVRPDTEAIVVVNKRSGTVVMGHNVRLSKVSIAHGNLTITIEAKQDKPANQNQQPNQEQEKKKKRLVVMPKGASVSDVVKGLNAVGAKPQDIIAILQAIKQAGALHAKLKIM